MKPTGPSFPARLFLYTALRQSSSARNAARNFADQDRTPTLALRRGFSGLFAIYGVFVLADVLCKPVIHERRVLKAQFLVSRAVVDLRCKDLLKGAARKIIWPVWHQAILSSERRVFIRRRAGLGVDAAVQMAGQQKTGDDCVVYEQAVAHVIERTGDGNDGEQRHRQYSLIDIAAHIAAQAGIGKIRDARDVEPHGEQYQRNGGEVRAINHDGELRDGSYAQQRCGERKERYQQQKQQIDPHELPVHTAQDVEHLMMRDPIHAHQREAEDVAVQLGQQGVEGLHQVVGARSQLNIERHQSDDDGEYAVA